MGHKQMKAVWKRVDSSEGPWWRDNQEQAKIFETMSCRCNNKSNQFWATLGLRKMSSNSEQEANKTTRMDIVVVGELLNVDGMTPKSTMKDVFPLIMLVCT